MYDTWYAKANACVTHGKPSVHMHANGHAYKWDMFVEEGGSRKGKQKGRKGKEEKKEKKERKERKGEKKEKKERKERKRKRKRDRGRRPAFSSSVH